MVMMHYIISFLHYSETMSHVPKADVATSLMDFGSDIVAFYAAIFLFYTNSFLIRRRKKEFGLYNILGMGKRNIAWILFWEVMIVTGCALGVGLLTGFVASKLAELGLINAMRGEVSYTLEISTKAVLNTVLIFIIIFALLFLNTLRQLWCTNAITLLRSENVGEKPPKANWFVGALGLLILATAYYIALTIDNPISAMLWFFVAVLLVTIGTQFTFVYGSVSFCRIMQKRKQYYYKPNHFVSVSSMVYRMKRNGAGLASICILATMVLVMISSTTCLYFGTEDSISSRYPKDINLEVEMKNGEGLEEDNVAAIRQKIDLICDKYSVEPTQVAEYPVLSFQGFLEGNVLETDINKLTPYNMNTDPNACNLYFVELEDYNRIMGEKETLKANEALMYLYPSDYSEDVLTIKSGPTLNIKKHLKEFITNGNVAMNLTPTMYVIVSDLGKGMDGLKKLKDNSGEPLLRMNWTYAFNTSMDSDVQIALWEDCNKALKTLESKEQNKMVRYICEGREKNRSDYYARYGSLFVLGIILSIVFIFATVLIIYYKQISEGYEDQDRFSIMQKVGMTKKEIRKSINSQLLTVFFMPLIGAAIHLAFAFSSIRKILLLFGLDNVPLFILTTVLSFLLFTLFYVLVYRFTSNAYYKIVSGGRE